MTNKEIQKKVEDMVDLSNNLVLIGRQFEQSGEEEKSNLESMTEKLIGGQAEILIMGIVAKDLLAEVDRNTDIQISVHEAGYEHGLQIELQNRCNKVFKKLNKAIGE